jgi:hypothetical protein
MTTFKDAVKSLAEKNKWKCVDVLLCPKCGVNDYPNIEFNPNNSGWKATCKHCNSYIKFVSHVYIALEERGVK